jgi:electron transport complex protein RnfC
LAGDASLTHYVPLAPIDGIVGKVVDAMLVGGDATLAVELLPKPSFGSTEAVAARDAEGDPKPAGAPSAISASATSSANAKNSAIAANPTERPAATRGPGTAPDLAAPPELTSPSALAEWIERFRAAGVHADRSASPDLLGQLNHVLSRKIDTIICTILDSDVGLRLQAGIAAAHAKEVIDGLLLLARITGVKKIIIGVEGFAAPPWITPLRAAAKPHPIRIVDLPNDYPQADPTLMLYTLAGRRFRPRPGTLPTSQGVLVLDAAAALMIGRARRGEPALATPLAIHDHLADRTYFLTVPIGTVVRDLLAELRITADPIMLRCGDLLRDIQVPIDAIITGGELSLHITPPELPGNPNPCIRCGWCIDTCPTRVQPATILEAAQRQNQAMADRAGLHACIECGLCSHVCPSKLPLLEAIRGMRFMKAE